MQLVSIFGLSSPPPSDMTMDLCDRSGWTEIDNDRLRHIRLHERVNDLPDANYATLKYFMGHLHKYDFKETW